LSNIVLLTCVSLAAWAAIEHNYCPKFNVNHFSDWRSISGRNFFSTYSYFTYCPLSLARKTGGADRDRTGDLMLAKHALSQLSYSPLKAVVSY
jgi:hypothetical protein